MGQSYRYYPTFGHGRRNDYAGAIAGYINAAHLQGAALVAPIHISPKNLAKKYHTKPENIRTALRRLCVENGRFEALLERTGRSEYRLTPLGIQLIENDTPQYFYVADLVLQGFTPKLSAVKNTNAIYPAAAAKWWGVSIQQWYKLKKQVRELQKAITGATESGYRRESKADTGASPRRIQGRQKADTGATQTQYKGCNDDDKSRSYTRARERMPVLIPKETEHGTQCVCEVCFVKLNRRLLVVD